MAAWKSELTADPATLGYAGKSHEEIETLLKTTERDVDYDATLNGGQLFDLLDVDEYLALVDANKRAVLGDLLRLGSVNPASRSIRKACEFVFGVGSKTMNALSKYRKRKGRRWEELGLPRPTVSDIADAFK